MTDCCGNDAWRGRLCSYHEGYEDGRESVAPHRWSREDVQRVLYNIVRRHEQAAAMSDDSELLRDAIRMARQTLIDNGWWPDETHQENR